MIKSIEFVDEMIHVELRWEHISYTFVRFGQSSALNQFRGVI